MKSKSHALYRLLSGRWSDLGLPNDPGAYGPLYNVAEQGHILIVQRFEDGTSVDVLAPGTVEFEPLRHFIKQLSKINHTKTQ